MYTIYELQHPVTKECRYIGITSKSLENRLGPFTSDSVPEAADWLNRMNNTRTSK